VSDQLDPVDNMFLAPLYRTRPAGTRAEIDRLLGFEPGHRDSNKIVVAYCRATPEIRSRIDELLGLARDEGGGGRVDR
jgi:hypothetical protein